MNGQQKFVLVCGILFSDTIIADQFHYNNVIIGDRASGLGGAYGAVSDDASGVTYNPAGLAFALSNDISGSANAFYQRKVTYKEAAYGRDFVEESQGTLAPFVGALGKIDHISPGLVWAFGIYATDSELKDQNDVIAFDNVRFHRTANVRANSNRYGFAMAKRFGGRFAIGFGLNYLDIDELAQVYQDNVSPTTIYDGETDADGNLVESENGGYEASTDADGNVTATSVYRTLNQNVRERLQASGIEPVLGFQYALSTRWALGLTIKKPMLLYQRYSYSMERTVTYSNAAGQVIGTSDKVVLAGQNSDGENVFTATDSPRIVGGNTEKDPLGEMPMEMRFAVAYFASTNLLITADAINYSAAKGKVSAYDRKAVTNYAVGSEYYITPSFPLRLGVFTNNDARATPKKNKVNQADHIDYVGITTYLGYVQPNSQIAFGGSVQQGKGKAQKAAGSTTIQDVEALAYTIGFSVSHNF